MISDLAWPLTRLRVVYRAFRTLGTTATLQLFHRKVAGLFFKDSARRIYRIRVPGYSNPIAIRGGNGSDGLVFYQIFVRRDYDAVRDLGNPAFIIDGGANIGLASIYFLNRYPRVSIVAVEPDPANLAICRQNLAPYGDRVLLVQGAVWSKCGRLVLERQELDWCTRVGPPEEGAKPTVEAFDIPSLMERGRANKIDLLKLDVEGSEAEIFARDLHWLEAVRNISIELHSDKCEQVFLAALRRYECDLFKFRTMTICHNLQRKASELIPQLLTKSAAV